MVIHNKPKKLNTLPQYSKEKVLDAMTETQYNLGLLQGSQKRLENPSLLISPLITKEATVGSKMEGTQSTITDVFAYDAGAETKHSDAQEVWNYRSAIMHAIKFVGSGMKINKLLLRDVHKLLLKDVRKEPNSTVGEFRNKTVWIGEKGTPIEKAKYIPPEHFFIPEYIEDLIEYINNTEEKSLIKAAVAHYQFEAIHPFDDGNGRIGRLLIPLMLFADNKMTLPILYISGYFERNKDEYIKALRTVDESGDYTEWIIFFMKAVKEQLSETQELVDSIYNLYAKVKSVYSKTSYRYDSEFIDFIFKSPIFTVNDIMKEFNMSRLTAMSLIKDFIEKEFVVETSIKKIRSKVYAFDTLLKLLS